MMKGTLVTIQIAVISILLAIVMAGVATALRAAPYRAVRWAGNVYVEMFRGTSLLVQLFWFFFVLPLPPFNLATDAVHGRDRRSRTALRRVWLGDPARRVALRARRPVRSGACAEHAGRRAACAASCCRRR